MPAGVWEKRLTMEKFQNYDNLVVMINPSKPHHVQSLDPFEFDIIHYYLEDSEPIACKDNLLPTFPLILCTSEQHQMSTISNVSFFHGVRKTPLKTNYNYLFVKLRELTSSTKWSKLFHDDPSGLVAISTILLSSSIFFLIT